MRVRKLLKIGSIAVGALLVLGFLGLVTFVWNPLEGSFPDLRDAIPRTVDFYARKQNLRGDFADFPEPRFLADLKSEHTRLQKSSAVRTLGRELERPIQDLQRLRDDLKEAQVDLVADLIGRDAIIAGRLTGKPEDSQWCLYTRVTWKICLGYGLMQYDWFRTKLQGVSVTPTATGYTLAPKGAPAPFHMGRVKDCLMISNHKDLLEHSVRLATREIEEDTLGRTADYTDEIETPITKWREKTEQPQEPIETSLDVQGYLRGVTWDEGWPNPQSPDDQFERVLAMFVNLKSVRKLMGPAFFERDGITLILKAFMNRQDQTPFQKRVFSEGAPPANDWVVQFMRSCVPEKTCAGLLLRVSWDSLMEELFATVDRKYREEANNLLAGTQHFNNVPKVIADLAPSFLPQIALLVRNNRFDRDYGSLGTYIKPSPIPAFALAFWVKPGEGKRIHDLLAWFHQNFKKFGFEYPFTLDSGPGGLEKIREWTHPHIEGTGEVAAVFMDQTVLVNAHIFLVGNSGPFIKEIVDLRYDIKHVYRSILDSSFFDEAARQIPPSTNAFGFVQGGNLRDLLAVYREFGATRFNDEVRDPGWEAEERAPAKLVVLRREFPGRTENSLSVDETRRFNKSLDEELKKRWVAVLPTYSAQSQGSVEEALHLAAPLHALYAHFRFDPQWIAVQARLMASLTR